MRNASKFKLNLAIFAYILIMMLFCVSSSPFINTTGTDSSAFRVMGRALVAGKIMYKDIFDHKGLYMYFINALAVIMTGKSLAGLFVIECVFMFICARTVYAILSIYADGKASFIGMQIFMMFALFRGILEGGNLTEDYGLTFQLLALYMLIRDGGRLSCLHMFLQGVCGGIVICLRPNIVMMWGGIALIAGYEMLRQKKFGKLVGNIAAGIFGVMVGIAPAAIYAVMNDSVSDTIFGIFGYNFMYVGGDSVVCFPVLLILRMLDLLKPFWPGSMYGVLRVALLLPVIIASCVLMAKKYRNFPFTKYYFAMLLMAVASVALSGRKYGHYYETIVPFCLPFAFWLASMIKLGKHKVVAVSVMVITIAIGMNIPDSIREMFGLKIVNKVVNFEDYMKCNEPYYSNNERVLVTGKAIFYNALEVIPQEKYFYIPSNKYSVFPEPRDAQVASILSGVNDVIIAVLPEGESEIYPETGKSKEIQQFLDSNYNILLKDEKNNITMYGKKRN